MRLVVGSAPASMVGTANEEWVPLLALRSTGTRPPLILLPALGGDIRCYAELVQELGADQPVYAFRPRGVDQDLPPHETIAEMIADYMQAVRKLQPTGPYHLGGWSTGGIYAFALASALEQAGGDVALVALFDTPLPSICDNVDLGDDAKFLCNLMNYASRFSGADVRFDVEELSAIAQDERFTAILAKARKQGIVPAETPESFIRRLVKVGKANVQVIQGYEPQPNKAPVHLFRPAIKGGLAEVSGRDMAEEEDLGWSSDVGVAVRLHELPGDHFTMMIGSNASPLAKQLRSIVNTVASGRSLAAVTAAK